MSERNVRPWFLEGGHEFECNLTRRKRFMYVFVSILIQGGFPGGTGLTSELVGAGQKHSIFTQHLPWSWSRLSPVCLPFLWCYACPCKVLEILGTQNDFCSEFSTLAQQHSVLQNYHCTSFTWRAHLICSWETALQSKEDKVGMLNIHFCG